MLLGIGPDYIRHELQYLMANLFMLGDNLSN